jgi:N-acetyltransferase
MAPKVKITYGSRSLRSLPSSSPTSVSSSSPPPASRKRQRPLEDHLLNIPLSLSKKRAKPNAVIPQKQKTLAQLHFSLDTTVLRTCSLCNLSYTHGAPDDEMLHRAHCARVRKGTEWGKEEDREKVKANVTEVQSGIKSKDNRKGRIVCFRANAGGKVGAKVSLCLDATCRVLTRMCCSWRRF